MIKPRTQTLFLILSMAFFMFSCQHEPDEIVQPDPPGPDPEPEQCDTLDVTYNGDVYPIFEQYCIFCHGGAVPQGGIDLTDYETVAFLAQSGQLLGAINHESGYSPMPKDADKLSFCKIRTITIWVSDTTFEEPGNPCDPDTIYFERDLLPLLQSGCAQPGCHDAITQQGEVRLTDYASVIATADVVPFEPEESDLYDVLIEDDPEKRMPPPPNNPWPQENIDAVYKWIKQGAQNLYCDDEECDTTNLSYTNVIGGIIQMHCLGCHNNNNPLGGLSLEGYNNVLAVANDGRLMGVVTHEAGYPPMPKNAAKLSDCKILQLQTWIDNGTPQ